MEQSLTHLQYVNIFNITNKNQIELNVIDEAAQ
jgi:hypothetical protein